MSRGRGRCYGSHHLPPEDPTEFGSVQFSELLENLLQSSLSLLSPWVLTWDGGPCPDGGQGPWGGASSSPRTSHTSAPLPSQRSRLRRDHMAILPQRGQQTPSTAQIQSIRSQVDTRKEAVVLLESPMFRRRNLDSEQDAPKVKISRPKWKLATGLAGLFQEWILVSQPLS